MFFVFFHAPFLLCYFFVYHFCPQDNAMLGCFIPGNIAFAVCNDNHLLDNELVGQFGLSVRYTQVACHVHTMLSGTIRILCSTMLPFSVAK
jgi:hypothetical protein